jgi:glycosyltransferase involved in cell wall biosynthesis
MGRYAPEKGLDVLLEAYAQYRQSVADPWPLTCCGKGPLAPLFAGRAGVEERGFIQPADQPAIMEQCGALVLTSTYEPWGVVIAEAAASGLPVLCSEACGASVELLRSYYNGLTVATGDARATAAAMRWLHDNQARLPEMGVRGRELSHAFAAAVWADRWVAMLARAAS